MDYQNFYQEMNSHYYRANCYHSMRDPDQDATSGNQHVLNATYHLVSKKLDSMYPASVEGNNDRQKEITFEGNTMIEPGLYIRHPTKANDQETQDDYIGLIVTNNIIGGPVGEDIYKYAQTRRYFLKYYFDNLKGSFKPGNWFGRFPWMVALIKRGAGEKLNWFNRLGYCAYLLSDVYFNKNKQDTSGRILQWLGNSVMKGESKTADRCIKRWEDNIKDKYPDGYMGEVLGIYHGTYHPFSEAMWNKM